MLNEITFYPILGIPLIVYGGVVTALLLLASAITGYLIISGKARMPVMWHRALAAVAVLTGLFHAILGLLAYL